MSLVAPLPSKQTTTQSYAPSHLHEAFASWVEDGAHGFFEPDQTWSILRLLRGLSDSADIMSPELCSYLDMHEGSTYGSAARKLMAELVPE